MKKGNGAFGVGLSVWVAGLVAIIVFILLLAFAPKNLIAPENGFGPSSSGHTSGTMRFVGVLPCTDCEGIRTDLTLRPDGTFTLRETYLGRIATRDMVDEGKWTTLRGNARNMQATIYRINYDELRTARNYLLLPDGNIKMVDEQQNEFQSSSNYTLKRQ